MPSKRYSSIPTTLVRIAPPPMATTSGSSEREATTAMQLPPYDGEIFAERGMLFGFGGQWERGMALVNRANALNAVSAQAWNF